uniref:RNA-dependent RNA polymerase n=1 Tax=Sugarcane yellow leaf virus TaxID=94290 RepID=V5KXN8_9VIRU|nr:RNA-dependent RNA polymerase [Sugarcane yellow leaf virus]
MAPTLPFTTGWSTYALLLSLWCLFCSCQTQPLDGTSILRDSTSSLSFYGLPATNSTIELRDAVPSGLYSSKITSAPNFSELSYSSMLGWIFFKMWLDCKTFSREATTLSDRFLEYTFSNTKGLLVEFLNNLLWSLIKLYVYAFTITTRLIMTMTILAWRPILIICLLVVLTSMVYHLMRKLFSFIQIWWVIAPFLMIYRTVMYIHRRLFASRGDEKLVQGFKSFAVPMSPPGHSVLEIVHPDDSHMGYASCVRLKNGEEALMTSVHCISDSFKVRSFRNGIKIPLTEFQVLLPANAMDIVLLRGPPEWKSILGAKAAHFTPVNQLNKGAVSFFIFDKEWMMHNAKVTGTDGFYATVLSNTEKGYSGAPYWNGKSIVGVHKGHVYGDDSKNYNLMSPIPPVKGLTAPNFVYESPSLQGDVFSYADVSDIADYAEEVYEKTLAEPKVWKPASGKYWWEMAEEEDDFVVEAKTPPPDKPVENATAREQTPAPTVEKATVADSADSRPGKRAKWRRPLKNTGIHPAQARRIYKRVAQQHRLAVDSKDRLELHCNEGGGETAVSGPEQTAAERREEVAQKTQDLEHFFQAAYRWEESTSDIPGFRKCGKLPALYHPPKPKSTQWGERIISEHPEMASKVAGFGWPSFGAQAEETSLRLQAARWLKRAESAEKPTEKQRKLVIDRVVKAYEPCRTNAPHTSSSGSLIWSDFLKDFKEAVNSLELDAGIGLPYKLLHKDTHRQMVEDPKFLPLLTRLTWNRLQKMSQVDFQEMTPEQLVREGLCDPIRLFVKGEPHKQAKLDEGRYRLIMSVSLVDQLVARVLFQAQNKREIALWRAIPSKPGFGLSTDREAREFIESLSKTVGCSPAEVIHGWRNKIVPTDCSGFDWSVADWMLEDDMEVRNLLTINNNELTRRLRACWLKCITNSVICTSGGVLYAQTHPGVQKSGSYNTSSSNSRIRVMAAFHCGADWAIAMGDDALESPNSNINAYQKLGFKVEVASQLEFCSHVFEQEDLARPLNVNKMLYRLIFGYNPACGNAEVLCNYLQAVASVLNELRHDPQLVATLHEWLVPGAATK